MAHSTQVIFERVQSDSGDVTFTVSARHGNSGENPPYSVLHVSHYSGNAVAAMRRGVSAAISQKLGSLTAANIKG
jgi:hypothetical protein